MRLFQITLLVPDYDQAIDFFCEVLGFSLVEDTVLSPQKRWVVVRPAEGGADLLLARAATREQEASIGQQVGGRVGFFLQTARFDEDHARMKASGVRFLESPRRETYGKVAVFVDPFGNRWDLIQPNPPTDSDTPPR